ncbi:hypothetical protein [Runella sp.]|jgi:hypothetical protein|uniref:hypothetical protein n=1 Tax=Runella sp. TaxID=1960881 RepID=UPI0026170626|nr:hypothetical protein [Runella sp.]
MKTAAFLMTFCLVIVMACLPYAVKKINGNDITVSESEDQYKISADYPEEKSGKVQRCLDEYLEPSGMSFVNARIDGDIALDNKANFYINTSLGTLKIKLDKQKNSTASYRRMKKLGEALKVLLAEK